MTRTTVVAVLAIGPGVAVRASLVTDGGVAGAGRCGGADGPP